MKQHVFLKALGIGAFIILLWLFAPFLKSFSVALLMVMATVPLHRYIKTLIGRYAFLKKTSDVFSASIVTLLFALTIFLPLSIFLFQLFERPASIIEIVRTLGEHLNLKSDILPSYLLWMQEPLEKLVLLSQMHKDEIISFMTKWLGSGLKTFASMLSEMVMIVVFFFFLTLYARPILLFFMPLVPLGRTLKRQFLSEMSTTMAVVFYTLLGVMVTQGFAFGVFIAFFEGYNALLLGFLAGITSVIPIVGTALVWIPIALGEYLAGNTLNAVIIALYSWAMMAFAVLPCAISYAQMGTHINAPPMMGISEAKP